MKEIEFGTNLEDIDFAGYKYVVVLRDHYRANGEGEIYSSEKWEEYVLSRFPKHWHTEDEDRGIKKIILSNEEVPGIVNRRNELECIIANHIRYSDSERESAKKELQKLPSFYGTRMRIVE